MMENNSLPDFKDGAISENDLSSVISWTQPRAENREDLPISTAHATSW